MWKWIKALNPFAAELKNTKGLLDFARVLLNEALAQLAQAEIELADKAFYVREFAAVSQERDALKAELAALRERDSVPVPAGVPSVVELVKIAQDTYCWRAKGECEWTPVVTAIRDRILAGLAAEMTTGEALGAVLASEDEVEALARVLRETHAKTCGKVPDAYELDGFRNDAIFAAIAHMRQRPEGE